MISWHLGKDRGGTGVRLRNETADEREIRLANTRKCSMKLNHILSNYLDIIRMEL